MIDLEDSPRAKVRRNVTSGEQVLRGRRLEDLTVEENAAGSMQVPDGTSPASNATQLDESSTTPPVKKWSWLPKLGKGTWGLTIAVIGTVVAAWITRKMGLT